MLDLGKYAVNLRMSHHYRGLECTLLDFARSLASRNRYDLVFPSDQHRSLSLQGVVDQCLEIVLRIFGHEAEMRVLLENSDQRRDRLNWSHALAAGSCSRGEDDAWREVGAGAKELSQSTGSLPTAYR